MVDSLLNYNFVSNMVFEVLEVPQFLRLLHTNVRKKYLVNYGIKSARYAFHMLPAKFELKGPAVYTLRYR